MLKRTLLLLAAVVTTLAASAQTEADQEAYELGYYPYPYNFVQIQGGVGVVPTNRKFTDLLVPTASIGVGRFFTPAVGARLHFNAWESKGGFRSIDDTYKFNYLNTNLDLLVNLNNLFHGRNNHLLNVIFVGGIGLNYAWGNDDLADILAAKTPAESTANAWGIPGASRDHLWSHNLRAGLLFDFNLAKNFNLGLEVDANSLDDRFNSKDHNRDDWMLTAQLTATIKFGHKAANSRPAEPVQPVVVKEPEPVVEQKQIVEEPVVVKEPEPVKKNPLNETIFYQLKETDVDRDALINRCVAWAKDNPGKTITVKGYADKGTGTAALNKKYAQQRADNVRKELIEKGVPENQISATSYGDTVQPFAENAKNRCVIIEGNPE